MPWTFSHPAAVLPLIGLTGPRKLSFAALAVGSMSPDFVYYIGRFDLGGFAHSPIGVLALCLPAGFLVLALAMWLREPIAQTLPQPHRQALLAARSIRTPFSLRSLALISASLAIGAATHLLWDAFTHEGRFFVRHLDALRVPLFTAGQREIQVFNIVQHASTVAGIVVLAYAYCRHARRFGPLATPTADDRRRYILLACIALTATILAAPLALLESTGADEVTNVSKLVVRQVVYATSLFFALLSCVALWRVKVRA